MEPENDPYHQVRPLIDPHVDDRRNELVPAGGGRPGHKRIIKPLPDVLDVVAVVSNPVRYQSRYDLFRAFEAHVHDSGARLTVVEMAYGDRPFEVTGPDNPRHVQFRSAHELWHKENLINLGIARLPRDARYVAWVDADLTFARPDWVQETLQQLQHFPIVQMFAEAHDLDPDGLLLNSFRSFAWSHAHGVLRTRGGASGPGGGTPADSGGAPADSGGAPTSYGMMPASHGRTAPRDGPQAAREGDPVVGKFAGQSRIAYWHHPGFAWAARREAVDVLGGLFDVAVVGEADYIMAKSLVGEGLDVLYPGVSPGYRKAVVDWQARALKLRGDLGYVPGTVLHHWHGRKASRHYWDRCKILTDTQFDPTVDLNRDWQGLYQLVDHEKPRSILLRDAIRAYFRSRNEDGIEL